MTNSILYSFFTEICFCSCINHYPHEEAEMSQGALQCTGWPVPLQFKDKCWQWKENWLTMIFQLHHTSYLIIRKHACLITGELQQWKLLINSRANMAIKRKLNWYVHTIYFQIKLPRWLYNNTTFHGNSFDENEANNWHISNSLLNGSIKCMPMECNANVAVVGLLDERTRSSSVLFVFYTDVWDTTPLIVIHLPYSTVQTPIPIICIV